MAKRVASKATPEGSTPSAPANFGGQAKTKIETKRL